MNLFTFYAIIKTTYLVVLLLAITDFKFRKKYLKFKIKTSTNTDPNLKKGMLRRISKTYAQQKK